MATVETVSISRSEDGALWRVTFGASTGNVLDANVMTALADVFHEAAAARHLKAICLEGRGEHFSYGASIQEHLPAEAAGLLERFHGMLFAMLDAAVPVVAAVRGRCLGGGLELASLCHRVIAARDAMFGQPEITLGVFAPIASVVLSDRVGRGAAEDLCLSGRLVTAAEALQMRLVDDVLDGDPAETALAWARVHLQPKSASSLRFAIRASRTGLRARLASELPVIERLYLDGLMATHDAQEGLRAFLDKRAPKWTDG